ncbi:xanthine dehydrogenase family protein subunit M [uncultured Xanthomonas sp.]|uniref:FAD binding domain-containing protein n=1 Tax=uncultured Xanthomonas sp. TaxID=152831 RepID=UPI0025EFC676|nr:xanthine dehydrogenase family protein subunit M [uncultured Xanthomonas sp.]
MTPFKYQRATSPEDAVRRVAANPNARFLGGGTNLLDLMKEGVTGADEIVDLTRLKGLAEIAETADGGLRLGALANNTQTANHPLVRQRYPLLSQAILAGATMQLRNMASNGGNLLQRTRCGYFYDTALPCNKREPGSGCGAREGLNRTHAIFGHSAHCVAVHPSDMCVALAALDATVQVRTPAGTQREMPFAEFHLLPEARADIDNQLAHGELIESITLPAPGFAAHSHYLKVRDRASYAFALISVAAALALEPDGRIRDARIAMGGVAHKPWRARAAERALVGQRVGEDAFAAAAQAEMAAARPLAHNAYKIPMGTHAMIRALHRASGSDAV